MGNCPSFIALNPILEVSMLQLGVSKLELNLLRFQFKIFSWRHTQVLLFQTSAGTTGQYSGKRWGQKRGLQLTFLSGSYGIWVHRASERCIFLFTWHFPPVLALKCQVYFAKEATGKWAMANTLYFWSEPPQVLENVLGLNSDSCS